MKLIDWGIEKLEDNEYWDSVEYWFNSYSIFLSSYDIEFIRYSWPDWAWEYAKLEYLEREIISLDRK